MYKFSIIALSAVSVVFGQAWLRQTPPPLPEPPMDSSQMIADKITASPIPVLVDFWAVWCRPCRMLAPTIEELKAKYSGKILFINVNVDVNKALAAYFRIQAIPAVFIIANKAVVDAIPGLQSRDVYENAIKKAIRAAIKPALADSAQTASPQSSHPKTAQSLK